MTQPGSYDLTIHGTDQFGVPLPPENVCLDVEYDDGGGALAGALHALDIPLLPVITSISVAGDQE